jgi:hypothetical protein
MKRAKLNNFTLTLNEAILYVAGVAVSFDVAAHAYLELNRRRELARSGKLPSGDYGVMAT